MPSWPVIGAIVWWLTGFDKTVSGESKRGMYLARALRCFSVLMLFAVFLWFASGSGGYGGFVLLFILPVGIALLLRSSVSELFTHGFLRMADPSLYDDRELDLKKTGEVNHATLEAALEFLGVKQDTGPTVKPLNEAARLRAAGRLLEAEKKLQALLVKNPADADAAMLLMRLYAQDLRQPAKAREVLLALEKQPRVAVAHIDFARRSIDEWSRPVTPPPSKSAKPAAPQSLDDLLAQGFFGSAIEVLEQKLREKPGDFDLLLRLATIQAVHCANLPRAEKLVRQIEADPRFTPEQAAAARAKLKEWQEARLQRK